MTSLPPRICVLDCHSGVQLCIKATFEELGYEFKFFPPSDEPGDDRKLPGKTLPRGYAIIDLGLFFMQKYIRHSLWKMAPVRKPGMGIVQGLQRLREMCARIARDDQAYLARLVKRLFYSPSASWRVGIYPYAPSYANSLQKFTGNKILKRYLRDVDYLLCAFPTSSVIAAADIAGRFGKKVILVAAHRFNMCARNREDNEKVKNTVLALHKEAGNVVAVAAEYDWHYVRHYLSIRPRKLYLQAMHAPFHIPKTTQKTILIVGIYSGPLFDLLQNVNKKYVTWCERHRCNSKYDFCFIWEVYSWYRLEDLCAHPAIILVPHSAYSITEMEIYGMNVPCFVPSVEFFIQHETMKDRACYPIYSTEQEYRSMEEDADSDESPNSYSEAAQRKWLACGFLYQRENTVVFDDMDDLFDKLSRLESYAEDLKKKMYQENKKRREANLQTWRDLGLERG